MILRTDYGLRAICFRAGTFIRLWKGSPRDTIFPVDSRESGPHDEAFEILDGFEHAKHGSTLFQVRRDGTMHCLEDKMLEADDE